MTIDAARVAMMNPAKPKDRATVWIQYPEGKWVRASYRSSDDTYLLGRGKIVVPALDVVNTSTQNPSKKDQHTQTWIGRIVGGLLQIILDAF